MIDEAFLRIPRKASVPKGLAVSSAEFRRVRTLDEADPNAVIVTLYRAVGGEVRGWYFGPLERLSDGGRVPYAARSLHLLGIIAVIRGKATAVQRGLKLYLVDPDRLWEEIFRN